MFPLSDSDPAAGQRRRAFGVARQNAVRGSLRAWMNLWRDPPPPGWNDLLALSKRGEMSFEGDLQPFMAHLQYFKDVLTSPRTQGT